MILKWQFERYEKTRKSGKFNMITEIGKAATHSLLTVETYKEIQKNYDSLSKKFKVNKYEYEQNT